MKNINIGYDKQSKQSNLFNNMYVRKMFMNIVQYTYNS